MARVEDRGYLLPVPTEPRCPSLHPSFTGFTQKAQILGHMLELTIRSGPQKKITSLPGLCSGPGEGFPGTPTHSLGRPQHLTDPSLDT